MKKTNSSPRKPSHGNSFGFSVIKTILLLFVVIFMLSVSVIVFYEGRKAYWDYRINEMCEIDGGIKIYNKYKVDFQEFELLKNRFGQIDIPKKGSERGSKSPIVHTYEDIYIRKRKPEVRRTRVTVTDNVDSNILAVMTIYSRVGGDLVALHPSYYSCPEIEEDLFSSVIVLEGE